MRLSKLFLAAAISTGLASLALAGPGPQYWTQQSQNQKDQKAPVTVQSTTPSAACASCTCCSGMKKS
jgi:hypothetical protein